MANNCRSRPAWRASPWAEAHAAALGVAQQRGEIGRAGKADPHRMFDAELAQPSDPLQDRLGIEAELGDDVDRHASGFRRLNLVSERAVEVLL